MIHSLYIPFPKSYLKFINLMRAIAIFPIALIFSLESSFYTNKSLFQLLIYETEYALSPFATKYSITYFPVEHTPADLQSCNPAHNTAAPTQLYPILSQFLCKIGSAVFSALPTSLKKDLSESVSFLSSAGLLLPTIIRKNY